MAFKPASKSMAKAKIAITGPAGSGKTFSALLLAYGLVGKDGRCAVIDTENNSASLYIDKFDGWAYDVSQMSPPYTIEKYLADIKLAVDEKYDCLIIDSASHAWAGQGGLLERKEQLDSRGGSSFNNWGQITKLQEKFKSWILHAPIHIIVTMRSKQEYVIETNDKGKSVPRKVGLAPVQREGIEYEFTTVFDIGMDHQFIVSKDRTGLFDGKIDFVSKDTGALIRDWLYKGPVENQTNPDDLDKALEQDPPSQSEPEEFIKARERRQALEKEIVAGDLVSETPKKEIKNFADDIAQKVQEKNRQEMKARSNQSSDVGPRHDDVDTGYGQQTSTAFNPGDYTILVGKKYKGMRLSQLKIADVRFMVDWAKGVEKPSENIKDLVQYGDDYLRMKQADADKNKFAPGN